MSDTEYHVKVKASLERLEAAFEKLKQLLAGMGNPIGIIGLYKTDVGLHCSFYHVPTGAHRCANIWMEEEGDADDPTTFIRFQRDRFPSPDGKPFQQVVSEFVGAMRQAGLSPTQPMSNNSDAIVLGQGQPGRPREPKYDEAYQILSGKVSEGKTFNEACQDAFGWFCKHGLTCPDKALRNAFKAAMKRRFIRYK